MRQTLPSNGHADLSHPVDGSGDFAGMAEAVARAGEVVGGSLAGVVAFGSWARGELTDASDIDMLIVVDPDTPVRRALDGAEFVVATASAALAERGGRSGGEPARDR